MYRVRHKVTQDLIQVWGVYSDSNTLYFVFYDKDTGTWYHDGADNYTLWGLILSPIVFLLKSRTRVFNYYEYVPPPLIINL